MKEAVVPSEKVVVDLTLLVERLKGGIEVEIKSRIQHFVLRALEQVILDLAKSELKKMVGGILREALEEVKFKVAQGGRVLPRSRVKPGEREWPGDAPPILELTLKEYITAWLIRDRGSCWSDRPSLGGMVDRHLIQVADEMTKDVIKSHAEQLRGELVNRLGEFVADKLIKKMGVQ